MRTPPRSGGALKPARFEASVADEQQHRCCGARKNHELLRALAADDGTSTNVVASAPTIAPAVFAA